MVVTAFLKHLGVRETPIWLEDKFPGQSVIEAIVGSLAIEHTSVDTFAGQRELAHRFSQLVTPLEQVLTRTLSGVVRVFLPSDALRVGRDWKTLQDDLARWIVRDVPGLPTGASQPVVPNTDVRVHVFKDPRFESRLVFWLETDAGEALPARLADQVVRKAHKLKPHSLEGRTRILLVESVDGINMSASGMREAVRHAFPSRPDGVDQIWFVDGSTCPAFQFCDVTDCLASDHPAP